MLWLVPLYKTNGIVVVNHYREQEICAKENFLHKINYISYKICLQCNFGHLVKFVDFLHEFPIT